MFQENRLGFFYQRFLSVFIDDYLSFSNFFMSPPLHCWLLRLKKACSSSELYPDSFLLLFFTTSLIFGAVVAVPPVLRIWGSDFYPQAFFTLHLFSIFGACTTSPSFYQGSIMSTQFFPEMCRASHDRPSNSVCLNHAVFHKHLINQGLYLNLSRYDYKWLVAKRSAKFF